MATDHPTSDRRAVPLDLPADHIAILRDDLSDWLDGARLESSSRAVDENKPAHLKRHPRRSAAAFADSAV